MAEAELKSAIIDAVDVINKAMGEMSAASTATVISPIGAATKTAHVIPPDALKAADDKVRGATERLKNAVAAANGRPAGDPFWLNAAPPKPGPAPVVAAQPAPAAKPSLFARTFTPAPKAPARPSWPGR